MSNESAQATRRLFIAVMPPAEVQDALARLPESLEAHRTILRVVRPEALHFTLRFLGEQTEEQERRAAEACAVAAIDAAFPLVVGGFGAFPNERRPRVVWLGVLNGAERLTALQQHLEDELLRRRVVARREEFTPHLTLARVRQDAAPAARAALGAALSGLEPGAPARWNADAVSLVRSVLTPRGSQYTVVGRWPLGGAS